MSITGTTDFEYVQLSKAKETSDRGLELGKLYRFSLHEAYKWREMSIVILRENIWVIGIMCKWCIHSLQERSLQ